MKRDAYGSPHGAIEKIEVKISPIVAPLLSAHCGVWFWLWVDLNQFSTGSGGGSYVEKGVWGCMVSRTI